MKKLLVLCLLLLLGLPPILSFSASYYLQNHFFKNFSDSDLAHDIQIKQFEYQHGWFSSNAQVDLYSGKHNTHIQTQNAIHHGPVIWSLLTTNPRNALSLYQINSQFELSDNNALISDSLKKGTASTRVSYLGKISPDITHPGLTIRLFESQLFADLPEIKSQYLTNGTVLTNFSANQLDIQDHYSGIYAIQPNLELTFESPLTLPSMLQANAASLSGAIGLVKFSANEFVLSSQLKSKDSRYYVSGNLKALTLKLDRTMVDETTISLVLSDLDQELVAYFSLNYPELIYALENNQWLVLLKHFAELIKHVKNQPQLELEVNGLHADQTVFLSFSGNLIADEQSRLNPFSMLENLKMTLNADIPTSLVNEINQPQLTDFLNSMTDKGLLIRNNQSYHSKLSFEDAKLRIEH